MEIRLKNSINLYDWQKRCLAAWNENGRRGIVHVITGAGKTLMALAAAADASEKPIRIRIVVPTLSLMYQWKQAISEFIVFSETEQPGERPIGYYCGEVKTSPPCKFTIYVVNSARHAISAHILRDMKQGISTLLILDECHHYGSRENAKIFHFLRSPDFKSNLYLSLGLSATPECGGYQETLVPAVGKEIFRYDIAGAADDHHIPDYFIFQVALSFQDKELKEYTRITDSMERLYAKLARRYQTLKGSELSKQILFLKETAKEGKGDPEAWAYLCLLYKRTRLCIMAKSRRDAAVKILELLGPQKKVLIFSERIEQAESLHKALSRTMSRAVGIYHSEMSRDARKLALDRFRYGETGILISCKALDEGIDVPAADAGIILSGTGVERQRIQRFGRLLRKSSDKDAALLYYLYVRQSREESVFLSDLPHPENVVNLEYFHKEKLFLCYAYEELAYPFLKRYQKNDPLYKEYRRCLTMGECRPDWLLPPEDLKQKQKTASDTRERNYYYVMQILSGLRQKALSLKTVPPQTDREPLP